MADLTYKTFSGETNVVSQAEFNAMDLTSVPVGTIYKVAGEIEEGDLSPSVVSKTATAVTITDITGATSGTVANDKLALLQGNANNYIVKDDKKYDRSSQRTAADSLTYVYNGYLSGRELQEAIEITVSTKAWVLNSDKLLTDRTIANGKIGGVSVKADFADGLEVANLDGNLSIYGALDADIAGRASKRPITPTNLNKAVLAALTDGEKITPTEEQQTTFKTAWGITTAAALADVEMSDEGAGNAIARYTADGQLVVTKDPSADTEVANKKYVDGVAPKYGTTLPDPTNAAYKVGCSFLNTKTGGLYLLVASGDANNRSWQLQTTLEKPQWRNTLPHVDNTQEVDSSKVLFTKVTMATTDTTNFPGMNGKSVTVTGYSANGFASGTIVCDETGTDIKYSPCFIGSITTTRASGILIKGTNSVAIVNEDNPSVTFTYEYLW